jgi:integrase
MSSPYEPHLRTDVWLGVEGFVVAAVDEVHGRTPYRDRDLMLTCSRLAVWATSVAGLPLERQAVFRRETIAKFIVRGCAHFKPATQGNMRSQLLRMSEVLLDRHSVPRRLKPLRPADPSRPYSDQELISLRNWADGQSTPSRRANANVLMSAGAGAGLSASEIGELRTTDVQIDAAGIQLIVCGDRPRLVPVLAEWEAGLAARVAELPSGSYLFRENHTQFYPNLISNFVARSSRVGVKPQTQRLRATWLVRHLSSGTPVAALLEAAGVESLESFTRYVRFVRAWDPELERRALIQPDLSVSQRSLTIGGQGSHHEQDA